MQLNDWIGVDSPLPEDERMVVENYAGKQFFADTYSLDILSFPDGRKMVKVRISGARYKKDGGRHLSWKEYTLVDYDKVPPDIRKLLAVEAMDKSHALREFVARKCTEIEEQAAILGSMT